MCHEYKDSRKKDFDDVKKITRETIMEIYPKYYPHGAVRFFAEHHSDENIMRDIRAGIVYLLISDEGIPAGTVTLTNNEIDRLFVLPPFQRRGYGKSLMDMAEEKISSAYDVIVLHASLPAKSIYLKRGYHEIDYIKIDTGHGDYLCADVMEKKVEGDNE